ncbi:MAG: ClpXP protease specificity-enhancing factor [Betaproteobacteria bacterium HGW-Betaproteobacteria-18]|nr:MAG: ClpXP protease specificity-enhancing factor [Betaproteobacteria bacterium HGW-Betaproteobacteria-18]
MKPSIEISSSQPYLIRAWHEWCTDNGLTPYVTVAVDAAVQVPREFVKDGEIVLNISYDSTTGLQISNDYLAFKARFAGVARDVMVPVGNVLAIFARENGQGMAFPKASRHEPAEEAGDASQASEAQTQDSASAQPAPSHLASVPVAASADTKKPTKKPPATSKTGVRPTLTRIK